MTKDVRELIRANSLAPLSRGMRFVYLTLGLLFLGFLAASPEVREYADGRFFMALAATACFVPVVWAEYRIRRDAWAKTYQRISGRIWVEEHSNGESDDWWSIHTDEVKLRNPFRSRPPFTTISDGQIDYLPRSGVILELRDRSVGPIFIVPGYTPPP